MHFIALPSGIFAAYLTCYLKCVGSPVEQENQNEKTTSTDNTLSGGGGLILPGRDHTYC